MKPQDRTNNKMFIPYLYNFVGCSCVLQDVDVTCLCVMPVCEKERGREQPAKINEITALPNAEIIAISLTLSKSKWHAIAKWVLAKVLATDFPQWHTD